MKPSDIRSQFDAMFNAKASDFPGIDFECEEGRSVTRQEFGPDCDVTTILRRHGGIPADARQPQFGEVDFDMSFRDAMEARRAADSAFQNIPPEIREKYPTWDLLVQALEKGEIKLKRRGVGDAAAPDDKPADSVPAASPPAQSPAA